MPAHRFKTHMPGMGYWFGFCLDFCTLVKHYPSNDKTRLRYYTQRGFEFKNIVVDMTDVPESLVRLEGYVLDFPKNRCMFLPSSVYDTWATYQNHPKIHIPKDLVLPQVQQAKNGRIVNPSPVASALVRCGSNRSFVYFIERIQGHALFQSDFPKI